jgi:hypothetical protein
MLKVLGVDIHFEYSFWYLLESQHRIPDMKLRSDKTLVLDILNYVEYVFNLGARGSIVVEALCYKPEGRGIASQ